MSDFKILPTVNGTNVELIGHKHTANEMSDTITLRYKKSTTQSLVTVVNTKILFPTVDYDYGNCWNTTLSRFTPPAHQSVGVYRVACCLSFNASESTRLMIYKNGTEYQRIWDNSTSQSWASGTTELKLLTTDYIEIWAYTTSASTINIANTVLTISSVF